MRRTVALLLGLQLSCTNVETAELTTSAIQTDTFSEETDSRGPENRKSMLTDIGRIAEPTVDASSDESVDIENDDAGLPHDSDSTMIEDRTSDKDATELSDGSGLDTTSPTDANEADGFEFASDTGTDPSFELTCENYCLAMEKHCIHEAFHPSDNCLQWCASELAPLPTGHSEETNTDTLACRMNWLNKAKDSSDANEKMEFCANANASGGNTCGSFCEVYCRQAVPVCTSLNPDIIPAKTIDFGGENPEADNEACMDLCSGFSMKVLKGVSQTEQHFGYGDTVQCRLHHLQAAMLQGPVENNAFGLHCGHAAPEPTELCLDDAPPNVINYCEFAIAFCPNLFAPDTDDQACRNKVGKLVDAGDYIEGPFKSFTDTDKNTVGCLNYWIMTAGHDEEGCLKGDYQPENWQSNGGEGLCDPPGPDIP